MAEEDFTFCGFGSLTACELQTPHCFNFIWCYLMQICCVVCLWCVFFYICNEFHCNHWLNALLFSTVWCFGTVRLSWCCRDCYMCSRHCWGFYAEYFRVVDWPTLCPFLMRRYSIFFPSCCSVFSSDLLSPPLFNTNWRPCGDIFHNHDRTLNTALNSIVERCRDFPSKAKKTKTASQNSTRREVSFTFSARWICMRLIIIMRSL